MALTLLQTIQKVCSRIGILKPNAAFTSTDLQIQQLVDLCEEEGQEQAARYEWQALQTEAIFTTLAAQLQGTIATIAPGYEYIVNDTIWNRTLRRPVYGPRTEQEWQQIKAIQINGPFNSYRIINDAINFYPNPVAGQTCAFEYISKNWINTSGGSSSAFWTSDTDTAKLNDRLMLLGTRWRWKMAKGLDYTEDFASYERIITDSMGRDAGKPRLSMSGTIYEIQPVIAIPCGSWGVS